jgi:hypothetical protein
MDTQNDSPATPPVQPPQEQGTPTGGVDLLGRPLLLGDVVMLGPSEVSVYTIRQCKPMLHPGAPAHANHLVLLSQLDPVVAPGNNVIPVIKISSGPQIRDGKAAGTTPRLVQP